MVSVAIWAQAIVAQILVRSSCPSVINRKGVLLLDPRPGCSSRRCPMSNDVKVAGATSRADLDCPKEGTRINQPEKPCRTCGNYPCRCNEIDSAPTQSDEGPKAKTMEGCVERGTKFQNWEGNQVGGRSKSRRRRRRRRCRRRHCRRRRRCRRRRLVVVVVVVECF